jgi:hypothetical protein
VIGWVGALVAVAVVAAIVLVLAVRPAARRFTRAAAVLRADLDVRLGLLRGLSRARPRRGDPAKHRRATPSGAAAAPSSIGGGRRHRRGGAAP